MKDNSLTKIRLESILAAGLVNITATPAVDGADIDDDESIFILEDAEIGLQLTKMPEIPFEETEFKLRSQLIPHFVEYGKKRRNAINQGGAQVLLDTAKDKLKKGDSLNQFEKAALDLYMIERQT